MNALALLPLILAAMPGIIQAVEIASDGKTSGADKKTAVLAAIEQAGTVAMGIDPGDTALIQLAVRMASPVIDTMVRIYNLRAIFTHKSLAVGA